MVSDIDCIKKWGEPQNTVKWQAPILSNWLASQHLDDVEFAEYQESCFPAKIYMNNNMHSAFTRAVKNLIVSDNLHKIKTWDGCFNIRRMKVVKNGKVVYGNKHSLHSWGIAFDIDAAWNGLGKTPTLDLGIANDIVVAGFDWGGDWKTKDGMHFQLINI